MSTETMRLIRDGYNLNMSKHQLNLNNIVGGGGGWWCCKPLCVGWWGCGAVSGCVCLCKYDPKNACVYVFGVSVRSVCMCLVVVGGVVLQLRGNPKARLNPFKDIDTGPFA